MRVFRNDRQLKATIGVSKEDFGIMQGSFEILLHESLSRRNRQRAIGGGRKGALIDGMCKLFFILFYVKSYPTYDLASFIFVVDRSRCCRWVARLMTLLEKALGRTIKMPKRRISSMEGLLETFPEMKDAFIDGTERRSQRSKIPHKQAKKYSGKKKSHTRKNIVVCDEKGRIVLLSPTKGGKVHDFTCFKKWGVGKHLPPETNLWADKAFVGLQNHCNGNKVLIPHKKQRGKELTHEQRAENKVISGLRMVVEHAIGGIKRFNCMINVYRNRNGQDDRFISVCAGLWNLHLQNRAC